jgi:CRISPR-associated protein Csx1
LVNGLPLAYYSFYPDVDHLEQLLNKAVELWLSNMKVTTRDGNVFVERNTRFRGEFIICTIIWAIARALNDKRKTEVKLEELKELRRRVFHRWAKLSSMISYDLEEVKRAVDKSGLTLSNWTRLDQMIEEPRVLRPYVTISYGKERTQIKPGISEDKLIRNFLAHSGLERGLIYVKKVGEKREIQLCYDLKRRNTIFKACVKGLHGKKSL